MAFLNRAFVALVLLLLVAIPILLTTHRVKASKRRAILGRSQNLSWFAQIKMDNWRTQASELADKYPQQIHIHAPGHAHSVSLTFDDGPDPLATTKILDILSAYHIRGSFFFVGSKIDALRPVVQRTYNEGHLVLNHSWSHTPFTSLSDIAVTNEIVSTEHAIYEAIGRKPALMRPPYGAIDERVIRAIEASGDKIALWSIDTLDWTGVSADALVENVVTNVRPGDIILMHCETYKNFTVEALPRMIEELQKRGFSFVDVATLLNVTAYKPDDGPWYAAAHLE